MSELRALIERVEKLEGSSREVDAEIDAALFGGRASHAFTEDNGGARLRRSYDVGTVFLHHDPMHNGGNVLISHYRKSSEVTGSLDAAIALCERVLPGNYREITGPRKYLNIPTPVPGKFRAQLTTDAGIKSYRSIGWGETEAIALLLATIRALEAQGGGE